MTTMQKILKAEKRIDQKFQSRGMIMISPLIQRLHNTYEQSDFINNDIMTALYILGVIDGGIYNQPRPDLTGSVSDVINLIKTILPGWMYRVASCSVSDDAWVAPDFNHPVHGDEFRELFPEELVQRDPIEALCLDVDLRPSGREPIALCIAMLLAIDARKVALRGGKVLV